VRSRFGNSPQRERAVNLRDLHGKVHAHGTGQTFLRGVQVTQTEMATVTGDTTSGYTATLTVGVSA
jgi:hypothetical protein